ncbi:hypothetical protein LJB88_02235 [Erysipelotrichaceae bacterium OttesenSCG-928-M19]|nr:hypothetical protein [Erysipelotrichaceae bacterium OttesenSCG-928-M19]
MKKFWVLLVGLFLLMGCSDKQDPKIKEEALQLYVQKTNDLASLDKYSMVFDGAIKIPESNLNETEMSANVRMDGIFNNKSNEGMISIAITEQSASLNESITMYFDKQYTYVNLDDQWYKEAFDSETQAVMDEALAEQGKMSLAEAEELFDSFKDTKYEVRTQDGLDGYQITSKMDLDGLMKIMATYNGDTSLTQFKGIKDTVDSLNIEYIIFIPKEEGKYPVMSLTMDFEIMKSKMIMGPFSIKLNESKQDVNIPKEAKKATESTVEASIPSLS